MLPPKAATDGVPANHDLAARRGAAAEQSDITVLLAPLWARKWLILIVGLLAAAWAYNHYSDTSDVYRSSTSIYFGRAAPDNLLSGSGFLTPNDRALANYAALMQSRRVGKRVAKRLKLRVAPEALTSRIDVSPGEGTDFLTIGSTGPNPVFNARLANAFAAEFIVVTVEDYRGDLQKAIVQGQATVRSLEGLGDTAQTSERRERDRLARRIRELTAARALAKPLAQQVDRAQPAAAALPGVDPTHNAFFAFILGLVTSSAAVIGLSRLEMRRFRSADALEEATGLPVLASVPHVRSSRLDPDAPLAAELREPLRRLDTTIDLVGQSVGAGSRKVILVTSAERGDGKSTVVRSLALALEEAGRRVAVIDSDLSEPAQQGLLHVERAPGLTDVLSRDLEPREALQLAGDGDVAVLAAGTPASGVRASGSGIATVLDGLRDDFDQILIDCPSPLAVSDALPMLQEVDGIVLVARMDHSTGKVVDRLLRLMERLPNAPVLGYVANDVPTDED